MVKLKPLSEQVIVITGASSGIGLTTAVRAAERGAKVVLASRNAAALESIASDIRARGGEAIAVVTDVSDAAQTERLASRSIEAYGGFDSWVNNAGLSIFGALTDIDDADHRQLFDINFWGVVYGSKIAARHLRQRGGAIINLGSVASDVALPLQGMYSATKHAIKGFTDALRIELRNDGAPVSVTLIKPASIDTPFPAHAMNGMDAEPQLPPPIYQPDDVAEAILYAAEHGGRDYYIGGGGKVMSSVNKRFPSAVDQVASTRMALASQQDGAPRRSREGALYGPGDDGQARGTSKHWVRNSLYTRARLHPIVTASLMTAAALAGAALISRRDD